MKITARRLALITHHLHNAQTDWHNLTAATPADTELNFPRIQILYDVLSSTRDALVQLEAVYAGDSPKT